MDSVLARLSLSSLCALAAATACLVAPASASARGWSDPVERGEVEAADVDKHQAKAPIEDVVYAGPRARASSHTPTRIERYTDDHGHAIIVGTSEPGVDLRRVAEILAGTVHGAEISELRVLVVPSGEVAAHCGGGEGIVACYGADDPDMLASGLMVVPHDSPDLVHAVVHEYGHHLDNQLINLAHLGFCGPDTDGSRRWFFARDAHDDLVANSGCSDAVAYERLLGELYAEDFVALNGIDEWFTSDFRPPTRRVLDAMREDIVSPFYPAERRHRARVRRRGHRGHVLRLAAPTFLTASLRGPRGRRNNLDLSLRRRGTRKPRATSKGRGSREWIEELVPKGTWVVDVVARRGRGRYRLNIALD